MVSGVLNHTSLQMVGSGALDHTSLQKVGSGWWLLSHVQAITVIFWQRQLAELFMEDLDNNKSPGWETPCWAIKHYIQKFSFSLMKGKMLMLIF